MDPECTEKLEEIIGKLHELATEIEKFVEQEITIDHSKRNFIWPTHWQS